MRARLAVPMGVGVMAIVAAPAACSLRASTSKVALGAASAGSDDDDSGLSSSPSNSPGLADARGLPADAGLEAEIGLADESGASDGSDAIPVYHPYEGGSPSPGCTPGIYRGSYTGTYENAIPTLGPVTLVLSQRSPTGEFVLPASGTWNAQWGLMAGDAIAPIISATAMLIGELDCKSNQFMASAAPNSMFTAVGFPGGTFTLVLDGMYDPLNDTLSGSFTYTSNAGNGGGTWQATLSD